MVISNFDCNVYKKYHIFFSFHLLLILFINYFIIELGSIFSSLDYFLQELVLLVVINFGYISQVNSHFDMMELCRV